MPDLVPFARRFHWDLLLRILQLSDTSTLAVLGAVSFDFLAASSPLLYRDVTVNSWHSLEKLFCERTETSAPSRINSLLSLSQIQTLHIDLSSQQQLAFPPFLSASRTVHLPLPLDLLYLSFSSDLMVGFPELHYSLLPKVNPIRVEYDAGEATNRSLSPTFHCPDVHGSPLLHHWTRIELLTFRGVILHSNTFNGFRVKYEIGFLPPSAFIDQRRVVRVHLPSVVSLVWVKRFTMVAWSFANVSLWEGIIVLVMRTEKEKQEMEAVVGTVEPESSRELFAVVVED